MRNLLKFLVKYHFVVLFVLLEAVSIAMIVNYNNYHKVRFLNSGNTVSGGLYSSYSSIGEYFRLRRINDELVKENTRLRNALQNEILYKVNNNLFERDSLFERDFYFTSARVINNSVNRRHNYITLNKGAKQGIAPDMGVVADNNVVGIILNVSEHYSTAISILNERIKISAKIKNNDYFGSLSWDGKDYQKVSLDEIPFHVSINKGDTIVTSGYSSIFPEGLMLGTISDFKHEGGDNFYKITVKLSTDFKKLVNVDIVRNSRKEEILELESHSDD